MSWVWFIQYFCQQCYRYIYVSKNTTDDINKYYYCPLQLLSPTLRSSIISKTLSQYNASAATTLAEYYKLRFI